VTIGALPGPSPARGRLQVRGLICDCDKYDGNVACVFGLSAGFASLSRAADLLQKALIWGALEFVQPKLACYA
jgi:hypothetical protein